MILIPRGLPVPPPGVLADRFLRERARRQRDELRARGIVDPRVDGELDRVAAPALLNDFTAATGNTNALTVSFGLTASAGDLLAVGVGIRGNTTLISGGLSGYTSIPAGSTDANSHYFVVDGDTNTTLRTFFKIAAGSETQVALTFSASGYCWLSVKRYSGISGSGTLVTQAGQGYVGSSPTSGTTGGSASAGDLAVAWIAHLDATISVGSIFGATGAARGLNFGTGGGLQGSCEDNLSASAGTGSAAFGSSRVDDNSIVVAIFKAAGGGGGASSLIVPAGQLPVLFTY